MKAPLEIEEKRHGYPIGAPSRFEANHWLHDVNTLHNNAYLPFPALATTDYIFALPGLTLDNRAIYIRSFAIIGRQETTVYDVSIFGQLWSNGRLITSATSGCNAVYPLGIFLPPRSNVTAYIRGILGNVIPHYARVSAETIEFDPRSDMFNYGECGHWPNPAAWPPP